MRKNSVYGIPPVFAMEEANLARLKERTGHALEDWIRVVKKSGPATERARIEWLKGEHGITTNYALWIARRADGGGTAGDYDPDAMVDEMFSGKKAALRPIYDRLLETALALGKDVKISPAKTIIPFYRNHVFAQVKPATNTRIDLGFAFRDLEPSGRLLSTGGLERRQDKSSHSYYIARGN